MQIIRTFLLWLESALVSLQRLHPQRRVVRFRQLFGEIIDIFSDFDGLQQDRFLIHFYLSELLLSIFDHR